jgi:hypothetical protein
MARHPGPVLVDTNVIIECFRVGCWRALSSGYRVETVQDCLIETQTGYQRRRPEQQIDCAVLRQTLAAIHPVTDAQLAAVAVRAQDIALDVGERSLWAHAFTRADAWVLCGPDKASLRLGVRLGRRDQLADLETLLNDVGYRPKEGLKLPYTKKWFDKVVGAFVVSEGLG